MKLAEFYSEQSRVDSPEIPLGSSWREDGVGPWSVVWLQDTAELVAFHTVGWGPEVFGQSGSDNPIIIIASGLADHVLDRATRTDQEEVRVLGLINSRDDLDRRLVDWPAHERDARGLSWLRSHVDP